MEADEGEADAGHIEDQKACQYKLASAAAAVAGLDPGRGRGRRGRSRRSYTWEKKG